MQVLDGLATLSESEARQTKPQSLEDLEACAIFWGSCAIKLLREALVGHKFSGEAFHVALKDVFGLSRISTVAWSEFGTIISGDALSMPAVGI